MIGRGPLRVSHVLAVSALTAGFVWAGFATHPSLALASATAPSQGTVATQHTVAFEWNGTTTQQVSNAATVGDFLRERNIAIADRDYVEPAPDVPLSDGMVVTYRAAVPVTIQIGEQRIAAESAAQDVGALLQEEGVVLGKFDDVRPSLEQEVPADGLVRVTRVVVWERTERRPIAEQTIHRFDSSISPGSSKVVTKGAPGERSVIVRFEQRDGEDITATVLASRVLHKPRPRVVVDGADEYDAFASLAATGIARSILTAQHAMAMVATAYTAGCAGCSGITAIGRPAGHGIVAVDPGVIPLGTRLFIPGYGLAIAGDTGGAIHGNRIDLGFNSLRDAMLFGRREVTVYRLK